MLELRSSLVQETNSKGQSNIGSQFKPSYDLTAIRFTDFLVNEIDIDKNIVWPPVIDKNLMKQRVEEAKAKAIRDKQEQTKEVKITPEKETEILNLLGADEKAKLMKFIDDYNM